MSNYFVFLCEPEIIERYSSGKGKEVSIIIFIFQMHKKLTDQVTIWLSACKIHISDCEFDKHMCMKYFIFAGL